MAETLVEQLIRHEGLRLKPYADTGGRLTIGVGRNLTDCGISDAEARALLRADIDAATGDLWSFKWFVGLNEARRRALVDMRFNLGHAGFRTFVEMLRALEIRDFHAAAQCMRASAWYRQVGARGEELALMVETGKL